MTGVIATIPRIQFSNALGVPLVGGKLYTYLAGTTTPVATYQDQDLTTANENPIQLDSTGSCMIWLDPAKSYKFTLKSALGITQPGWPVDNISGASNLISLQPTLSLYAKLTALAAAVGSSFIGFIQSALGAVASTVQDKLRENVSVLDFMTKAQRDDVTSRTGSIDVTAAVQAALDYIASLGGGGRVHVPAGLYMVSAPLRIGLKTYLYGDGMFASLFKATHSGDFLKSTFPINSSTSALINVRDLGAYTTSGASTGGGYVDVGGTYINVENCFFEAFKYNVVLDQSELVVVDRCYFLSSITAGVWLVNGPDHTAGANKGYTNRITVTNCQFNSPNGYGILDDGGGNHLFSGNNFNQMQQQIRVAGCGSLTIQNNEFELATAYPVLLAETTLSGTYVGPVVGFNIQGNGFGGGAVSIFIQAAHGGDISGNVFYQYSTCAIEADFGSNWRVTNVNIGGNYKSLINGSGRTDGPLFSTAAKKIQFASAGRVDQMGMTYCNQAPSGTFVTTPVSMEDITEGCLLRIMNVDGSNVETVQAYNVTGTTFTAVYATAKSPGCLIFVLPEQPKGTWTPTPSGSATAGAWTTSVLAGVWELENGRATANGEIIWSAMTGTGQMQVQMPFKAKSNGILPAWPIVMTGPGAIGANVGQIALSLTAGSSIASLVYLNTSTGTFSALQCPASGSLYFSVSYEI